MFLLLLLFVALVAAVGKSTRCSGSNTTTIVCSYQYLVLPESNRSVYFQLPDGNPPSAGWPFVVFFQGSFFGPEFDWNLSASDPFGAIRQIDMFWELLTKGIAVVAPSALDSLAWETNAPPYDVDPNLWYKSDDFLMMSELLNATASATLPFGAPLDNDNVFAMGISSGGYMTSRVAIDLPPGTFRAVVDSNGAYMTCLGPACVTPAKVPSTHPPTMLLYGGLDPLVPFWTVLDYQATLKASNVTVKAVRCLTCTHEWIPDAKASVVPFFEAFLR